MTKSQFLIAAQPSEDISVKCVWIRLDVWNILTKNTSLSPQTWLETSQYLMKMTQFDAGKCSHVSLNISGFVATVRARKCRNIFSKISVFVATNTGRNNPTYHQKCRVLLLQSWSEMSQWLVRKHPVLSPQTTLRKNLLLSLQKQQEMSQHWVKNTQFCCYKQSCNYPDVTSEISRENARKYPSPVHSHPSSPCQAATGSSSSSTPPGLLPALPTVTSTWALHLPVLWLPSFILLKLIPESVCCVCKSLNLKFGIPVNWETPEVGREGTGNVYCILRPSVYKVPLWFKAKLILK